eukprot:1157679-Pelagomonas_calceolata.AAC.3
MTTRAEISGQLNLSYSAPLQKRDRATCSLFLGNPSNVEQEFWTVSSGNQGQGESCLFLGKTLCLSRNQHPSAGPSQHVHSGIIQYQRDA